MREADLSGLLICISLTSYHPWPPGKRADGRMILCVRYKLDLSLCSTLEIFQSKPTTLTKGNLFLFFFFFFRFTSIHYL